jgi:hypothetical protein
MLAAARNLPALSEKPLFSLTLSDEAEALYAASVPDPFIPGPSASILSEQPELPLISD